MRGKAKRSTSINEDGEDAKVRVGGLLHLMHTKERMQREG